MPLERVELSVTASKAVPWFRQDRGMNAWIELVAGPVLHQGSRAYETRSELSPSFPLELVSGVEPPSSVYETEVLPERTSKTLSHPWESNLRYLHRIYVWSRTRQGAASNP